MASQPPIPLSTEIASDFAELALRNLVREFPNHPMHVMDRPGDCASPRQWHPIFFGSYDWHSAVHGYWLLARLLRQFPDLPQRARIEAHFQQFVTDHNVAIERTYFEPMERRGFERPYGWAWLLMLCDELGRSASTRHWAEMLSPLAKWIRDRFVQFLAVAHLPMRVGTHGNITFAMVLARPYAESSGDVEFMAVMDSRARQWFENDCDCQAWEPSLNDFLSPALMEAMCMRAVLGSMYREWLGRFLPGLAEGRPAALFEPATSGDRADGQMAHLDGLNFSRAWCFKAIASAFATDDPTRSFLLETAHRHVAHSFPHITGEYAGEHWLATFAVLAMI